MPLLKILNVSGNLNLKSLPNELATCDNLTDLVFDIENVSYPAGDVLATGTQNILKFLSSGELSAISEYAIDDDVIKKQSKLTASRIMGNTSMAIKKQPATHDQLMQAQDHFLENELHKEQQRRKEQMLSTLIEQQKQAENAVSKVQLEKDDERKRLINDIRSCKFMFMLCNSLPQ